MATKTYIGIDVGARGFIAVMRGGEFDFVPLVDSNDATLAGFFASLQREDCVVVMEEVHAIFGASAKSTFNFGAISGFLRGLLVANNIPYHLVPPKTWQKEIWGNTDKVKKGKRVDTKATSLNAAVRLFPKVDFRRTPACKKPDDNKVDALLICEYGRRKNL